MREGVTYIAEVIVDPLAYRGYKNHRSLVGRIVQVELGRVVNIRWGGKHDGRNSVDRKCVRIIGEAKGQP